MLDANEQYKEVLLSLKRLKLMKNKMLNQVEQNSHFWL